MTKKNDPRGYGKVLRSADEILFETISYKVNVSNVKGKIEFVRAIGLLPRIGESFFVGNKIEKSLVIAYRSHIRHTSSHRFYFPHKVIPYVFNAVGIAVVSRNENGIDFIVTNKFLDIE